MTTSNNGLNLIKKFEGLRTKAYQDAVGVWTIGYGHTNGVKPNQVISLAEADKFLKQDIKYVENALNSHSFNLQQNQYDALVSLFYNIGPGHLSDFLTLLQHDPNSDAVVKQIKKYVYAGGKILNGLVNRRNEEALLYKNSDHTVDNTVSSSQSTVSGSTPRNFASSNSKRTKTGSSAGSNTSNLSNGGVDETKILVITEPTIKLDELSILDLESGTTNAVGTTTNIKPSKFLGAYIPYVVINGHTFNITSIISFELFNTTFLPTIRLKILDETTMFQGMYYPKDGDVINFYLRANNETVYKPIRIDFDIINISPSRGASNLSEALSFTITGQMKIPGLMLEESKGYPNSSSYDVFVKVSQDLKLGFASNITSTSDKMSWINPYDTVNKFIKDVLANSYRDEKSFFTAYIDPYYIFNYINVNGLFSNKDDLIDSELYRPTIPDAMIGLDDNAGAAKTPQMLTNLLLYQGTSKYLESYKMNNISGNITLSDGYKRYAQYYDVIGDQYNNEFVEPMETEGTSSEKQMKGRKVYDKDKNEFVEENIRDNYIKYKYLGKQSTGENGNVHDNYMYSAILNHQNMNHIKKLGMVCQIPVADMTFYRYQRIPVLIYDYEFMIKKVTSDINATNTQEPTLNKTLSGFYVIDGIEYFYKYPGPIQQRLYLLRRDYNPIIK